MPLNSHQFSAAEWLSKLQLPAPDSHKGDNGKILVIGGSKLFHAASKWSLDIASKLVDMVFYASTPENEALVKSAKGEFWNGIVIGMDQIASYLAETDVVIIGPGMERTTQTEELVNELVTQFPTKKWLIDAGALQMIDPKLIPANAILTPHQQELKLLAQKILNREIASTTSPTEILTEIAPLLNCTVLCKGQVDLILNQSNLWSVAGGNPGMTKGGTGDVLAGLVGGLYCQQDAVSSCLIGSHINKLAGDELASQVGPFFNASDLVNQIPKTLWRAFQASQKY